MRKPPPQQGEAFPYSGEAAPHWGEGCTRSFGAFPLWGADRPIRPILLGFAVIGREVPVEGRGRTCRRGNEKPSELSPRGLPETLPRGSLVVTLTS